jgi:hypothetical protein
MGDSKDQPRRFSLPWDIEDNGACFIVRNPKSLPMKALVKGLASQAECSE